MAKIPFQDMVKAKKVGKSKTPTFRDTLPPEKILPERPISELIPPRRGGKHALWFVAIISIVFLIFSISFLFSSAEVTIVPNTNDFKLNASFSAIKDASSSDLTFDLMVLSGEQSKTIQANGVKDSATNATGKVILYNAFGTASQRLDINTRLEGSNGKLYKTAAAVTLPGMTGKTPGSIEVGIYGAETGPEYNSDPLDFKIFGFKGTPKYTKFYGRSKGGMTGGFKGQVSQISETDKASASAELKNNLETKLLKDATDKLPTGFVLFKDATLLDIDKDPTFSLPNNGSTTVSLKGTLYGFILNEKNLTKAIVSNLIKDYDGSEVLIPKIQDLAFSLSPQTQNVSTFTDSKNISFTLIGNVKVIWIVDTEELAQTLMGISKKDLKNTLAKYPNIASADSSIRPAWKSSFPEKRKNIKIIVNYPNE